MISRKQHPIISPEFAKAISNAKDMKRIANKTYKQACVKEARANATHIHNVITKLRDRNASEGDQLSIYYAVLDSICLIEDVLNEFEQTINN
jgi:hypothetical protein